MECNNILLDYYKEEKKSGYQGSQLLSAGEGQCAEGLRGIWALWSRWSLGLAPRGTEHRGRSAGCSEPPLCVLQTFHTGSASPGKLQSLIISVSLQWCFFGLFCIWALSGVKPVTLAEGITSPLSL